MKMQEELSRVTDDTASTQVEVKLGRTGGSFNNQSRKKWVNYRVVFINKSVSMEEMIGGISGRNIRGRVRIV